MTRLHTCAAFIACLGFIYHVNAQTPANKDYHNSLSLSGNVGFSTYTTTAEGVAGDNSVDANEFTLGLSAGYEYWLGNSVSTGIRAQGTYTEISSDDNDSAESKTGFIDALITLKYHFVGDSRLAPYLGLQGGVTFVSMGSGGDTSSASGWSVGPLLGVNYYLNDDRSVSIYVEYAPLYTRYDMDDSEIEKWRHSVNFGIQFYF